MTLLRQLQEDAVNPRVDLITLLRKARILAARLNNTEFENWIKHEMNGYPEDVDTPNYRILGVHAKAYLLIGNMQLSAADVMVSQLPERFRIWGTTCHLRHSVSELASLIASLNVPDHPGLICPWPQEIAVRYGASGYGDDRTSVQCVRAWQEISGAEVAAVIEIVRNKLLEFVLQIEAEAPDAGEATTGDVPVPQERVSQIVNATIVGGVTHFGSSGSSDVANTAQIESMSNSQIQQAGGA